MDYLQTIPEIQGLFEGADYIGVKTIDAENQLEPFLVKIFSYRPSLIRFLYRIRAPLVRLLGFRQDPLPEMDEWIPAEFPMLPCGMVWFFTVREVKKEHFWIAGCPRDRHLDADLAVVVRSLNKYRRRFYLITVVRYKHWTGPLYFTMIRLFNLFIVDRMARCAAR